MSEPVKLALLGCGAISHYHVDGIQESAPRIDITAVIDTDLNKATELSEKTGAQVFTSLDEALNKGDFDAVDVMLPHDLHEWAAKELFTAGKHVLMEKPMAPTIDACERILAAAAETNVVFMIAENSQYWPEVVAAKRLIDEGAIGDIITARAAFVMEFDNYWFKDEKPWRYDKERTGGGIVVDGGAHWIRPLRMWMGEIDEAIGIVERPMERMQGESLARALLRFESGRVAILDAMMLDTILAPDPWWRITGTKGEILIDGGFDGGLRLFDKENREGRTVMEPMGYAKSFGPELDDFSKVILDGVSPQAGPEVALGELRTALAVYRSATSKRWEKIWD